MNNLIRVVGAGAVSALLMLATGCIVTPGPGYHEGYYDRDHHRYYHENAWHECGDHDERCR